MCGLLNLSIFCHNTGGFMKERPPLCFNGNDAENFMGMLDNVCNEELLLL